MNIVNQQSRALPVHPNKGGRSNRKVKSTHEMYASNPQMSQRRPSKDESKQQRTLEPTGNNMAKQTTQ